MGCLSNSLWISREIRAIPRLSILNPREGGMFGSLSAWSRCSLTHAEDGSRNTPSATRLDCRRVHARYTRGPQTTETSRKRKSSQPRPRAKPLTAPCGCSHLGWVRIPVAILRERPCKEDLRRFSDTRGQAPAHDDATSALTEHPRNRKPRLSAAELGEARQQDLVHPAFATTDDRVVERVAEPRLIEQRGNLAGEV